MEIFRGYIRTHNKVAAQAFGHGEPLLSLKEASKLSEYAGVLNGEFTTIDIDDGNEASAMMKIVTTLNINCRAYKTTRGIHFVFRNATFISKNRIHALNAIGFTFDVRCGKNAYIVRKFENIERTTIREFDESRPIDVVPYWSHEIVNKRGFVSMLGFKEHDGRNGAMFSHMQRLLRTGLPVDKIRDILSLINRFIFAEPLNDDEFKKVTRDESFEEARRTTVSFVSIDDKGRERVSCPALATLVREELKYFFVRDNVQGGVLRYVYNEGYYQHYSDDMFKGVIKKYISDYNESLVCMRDVNEVFSLLSTDLHYNSYEDLNGDEDIINFNNGVLRLSDMALLPHSSDFHSTIRIPCDWVPEQSMPNALDSHVSLNAPLGAVEMSSTPVFDGFINSLTGGNESIQQLLLEFCGACLSNIKGWRMKKALFMVGPGDTGKSQLKSLVERLLGRHNFIGIDIKELEARFGTGAIYGKRLAGSSDMSFMTIDELRMFKKCTGGDSLFAEFKGQNAFEFTYHGLLWFCMNRLPKFGGDDGKWVYDRIMHVSCNNIIPPNQQDKCLLDKMYSEREGIVFKMVMALKSVIANGYRFSEPESVMSARETYRAENNTAIAFFHECMEKRPAVGKIEDRCTTGKVYKVYGAWCKDNNHGYAKTAHEFRTELAEYLGKDFSEIFHKKDGRYYKCYTLSDDAKKEYEDAYGFYDIVSLGRD